MNFRTFLIITLVSISSPAFAQAPAPAPAPAPVAGFQDGFFVQSPDGEYRFVFGMVAQADGRFSVDDPTPITNTFSLRKLRPTLTGQVTRYFTFKLMPDFGNGTTTVPDAYIELRLSPAFRIRTGKDKTPVGYELLQGDANLWFMERSQASNLVPNRDLGVELVGDVAGGRLSYQGGLFNGVPDGASSTTEVDTNNSKDFAGRIVVYPLRTSTNPILKGFGFHVGASSGTQTGALPVFRTSVGQTYYSYDREATASGHRTRVSPALFLYAKSFGAFGEFVHSTQEVAKSGHVTDVANDAWQVSTSWMLTGEAATYGAMRPKNNFNPAQHHWGALQVLARYSELSVDPVAFESGLAANTASQHAKSFSAAMNWYPNPNMKYYATFEHTTFEGGATRPSEDVILFRTQINF
ncbi:MAG TPA: porin [Vicinamibacterales bacterium]